LTGKGRVPLEPEDRDLMARLLRSADLDVSPAGYERRLLQRLAAPARGPRVDARRLVIAATALGAVAVLALVLHRGTKPAGPDARHASARSSEIAAEPPPPLDGRPCFRGQGGAPLLDDFEGATGTLLPLDGRQGRWCLVVDSDPTTCRPAPALLRPEPSAENRRAMHFQTGELRDWGAVVEARFEPSCYDASAYAGVAFSARGPGRLYVAAREVRVVSARAGGTCLHDCYNDHAHKVDLGPSFRRYEVRWRELHQRGYEMPALDPRKLFGLAFVVRAEDTPCDVWIDEVELLIR
jgi:hypothetical protein